MKRSKILLVMLLALVLCFSLTACGGDDTQNGDQQASQNVKLNFASGGTQGTYYPYCGAVAQIWGNNIENFAANVQATGGSAENVQLVAEGAADVAIVQNDVMQYAYDGINSFEGNQIQDFSVLGTVYAEVCQIVIDPNAGINSVADLAGKKVSVGDIGSGVNFNAQQILAAYGLTFDDLDAQYLGFGDSANAIKDGQIVAAFVTAGTPTPAVMELASTNDIAILPITGAEADKLVADYPFYTSFTIPQGTYSGMDQDVVTLAVKATLIVSNDLSEEVVYNMTKTLFENQEALAKAHAKGTELNIETAADGVGVPFHPGAEKYLKEAGIL